MQLLDTQQTTSNAAATCIARTRKGARPCRLPALPGADWCSYHGPTPTAPVDAPQEPDPAPVEESPEGVLMALEAHLARLRAERDEAESQASAALARANRASVALIATSRERAALLTQINGGKNNGK